MRLRVAAIIAGLLVAGSPAVARGTDQPAPKKVHATALARAAAPSGGHRKAARTVEQRKKTSEAGQLKTPEGDPLPTDVSFPGRTPWAGG